MRKSFRWLGSVTAAVCMLTVAGVWLASNTVMADPPAVEDITLGQNTDSGALSSGKCTKYCTSWGGGWVQQSVDEYMSTSNGAGLTNSQKQDIQNAIVEQNMQNPVVLHLGFFEYTAGGGQMTGGFGGQITPDRAAANGMTISYNPDVAGSVSQQYVEAVYNHLVSLGIDLNQVFGNSGAYVIDANWFIGTPFYDMLLNVADPTLPFQPQEPSQPSVSGTGTGIFASSSKIVASGGGDIPGGISAETGWDGYGEIKFSTDQDHVHLSFEHTVGYTTTVVNDGPHSASSRKQTHTFNDTFATATTNWNVSTEGGSGSGSGSFSRRADQAGSAVQYTGGVDVSLAPGETKRVCQHIRYQSKLYSFVRLDHIEQGDDADYTLTPPESPAKWGPVTWHEWKLAGQSSAGTSGVCAYITRPEQPDAGDGTGGTGSTGSNIMFAGETADVSWNVSGKNADTRRLREWQAVVYRVPVGVNYSSSLHTGSRAWLYGNQRRDVCHWYSNHDYCDVLSGRSGSFGEDGQDHSYNTSANIVVPDTVGYKYCNSFGYRYEYWWYSSDSGWHQDKSYWRIHDASCRTIAKKPSVAIWNGGMLSAGGIKTSSSTRFDNAIMGIESNVGGPRTLYGSWVEYLAAIGRNVDYFTSGASLAIGSKTLAPPKSNPLDTSNSSLTIANKNRLGSSGIGNNSTYRTRLTTFLENQATRPGGDTLGAMENVAATQILRYDGNLKITGNITTLPGNYTNIYNIPQVVIFVHGNVEIASNVTRLDAWLIVDGKINTCGDFASGTTESDAVGRPRDVCNKQLAFNGPVMASSLTLNRSFGSDPLITYRNGTFGAPSTKYAAGEIFNLRMDTYLWAYAQAGRYASSYTESYTRELAPRY